MVWMCAAMRGASTTSATASTRGASSVALAASSVAFAAPSVAFAAPRSPALTRMHIEPGEWPGVCRNSSPKPPTAMHCPSASGRSAAGATPREADVRKVRERLSALLNEVGALFAEPVRPAPEQEAAAAQDEGLERRFSHFAEPNRREHHIAWLLEQFPGLPREDLEEYMQLHGV